MKGPRLVAQDQKVMTNVSNLTGLVESMASLHILQTKKRQVQARNYFNELRHIYGQVRVDNLFRYGRLQEDRTLNQDLFIIITTESGFSGELDQKLIEWTLTQHDPTKQDIIVIGHHGAVQLSKADVAFLKYYKLPDNDQNINVDALIAHISRYRNTNVFYQTYVSLLVQDVRRVDLKIAVEQQGATVISKEDIITDAFTIFRPSTFKVVAYLEKYLLKLALTEIILDAKLTQYAAHFRAMGRAKSKVVNSMNDLNMTYARAKRNEADERLREVLTHAKHPYPGERV